MRVESTPIDGVRKIVATRFQDGRGYFSETFKECWFRENVEDVSFVQDNESISTLKGTLRGMHFQRPPFAQGKLIRCTHGAILDVVVDLRNNRPSFGEWYGLELSEENGVQLWIPPGFAHGFVTLAPMTRISYKVTEVYSQAHEMGFSWDDKDIGISWPLSSKEVVMSDKDRSLPGLAEIQHVFDEL